MTKFRFVEGPNTRQWLEPPKWNMPISSPLVMLSPTWTVNSQLETSAMPMNTIAMSPMVGFLA